MLELNHVYNMDCMDGMREIPDKYFELAIVDPPYGTGRKAGFGGGGRGQSPKRFVGVYDIRWDIAPEKVYFEMLLRVADAVIVWGGNHLATMLPLGHHWIFWDKQQTMPSMGDGELAWTNIPQNAVKKCTVLWNGKLRSDDENLIHPTQKPVALYKWLLANYAHPGDKILDTHVGSGSSIIACIDMGFEYMGFEIDADYYNAMQERIYHFTRQDKLALGT